MGDVYLAEHEMLKRPCVVKLIRPDKVGDETTLARFQREVQATARLSHWNTVEILDYGRTEDGTFYYVMEYLPGMTLAEMVKAHGPLPPERVVYLLLQVCDALREAHQAGLVHRDVKPENIVIAQRGGVYDVAKILDFGLVEPISDAGRSGSTAERGIAGSPLFMSPEQAGGSAGGDPRTDVYSLGAVAYYVLTGRPPFMGDGPVDVMDAHVREEPAPVSQHNPDVPGDLERVIHRCLAKDAADRFQDMSELGQALSQCEATRQWSRADAAKWWEQRETPS
jgi:serine/threonine-protein kinase